MSDDRVGKLAEDALATLRELPDTRQLPRDLGWGDVMTFEGWSVRRARQAQRAPGLRLVERGGSVAEVRPTSSYMQCAPRQQCRGAR
jgi:hypothetical protein